MYKQPVENLFLLFFLWSGHNHEIEIRRNFDLRKNRENEKVNSCCIKIIFSIFPIWN